MIELWVELVVSVNSRGRFYFKWKSIVFEARFLHARKYLTL